MYIDSYSFGEIVVDGQVFTSDLIIYPNKIDASWWRKQGHYLQFEDLKEISNIKPALLIIGTGASGLMEVPIEFKKKTNELGIELIIDKTDKAVRQYNTLYNIKNLIAAFHLTC